MKKTQYAVILETLALKKSATNEVFEEIARDLERYLSSEEFNQENERKKSKSKGKRKDSPLDKIGKVTIWLVPMPFRHA